MSSLLTPNIRDLLRDPVWRRMFTRAPRVVASQLAPDAMPWTLYVALERPESPGDVRWARKRCPTYPAAYASVSALLRDPRPGQVDLCITSTAVEYAPPPGFNWNNHSDWHPALEWCARCRRPSLFRPHHGRHAITPLRSDNPKRCFYCGMSVDGFYRNYQPVPIPTPVKKVSV